MTTGKLKLRSWARPDRLTTLNDAVFERRLGRLSTAKHAEIAAAVRSLDLTEDSSTGRRRPYDLSAMLRIHWSSCSTT